MRCYINSKPHSFLLLMFLLFGIYHTIKGKLFLRAILFPDIPTLVIYLIIWVFDLMKEVLVKLYYPEKLGDC